MSWKKLWHYTNLKLKQSSGRNTLKYVHDLWWRSIAVLCEECNTGNEPGFAWLHRQSIVPEGRRRRWRQGSLSFSTFSHVTADFKQEVYWGCWFNLMTRGSSSLTGNTLTITCLWSWCLPSVNWTVKVSSIFSESSCMYIRSIPESQGWYICIWIIESGFTFFYKGLHA